MAAAPILTAVAAHLFLPDEKLSGGSFAGFSVAIFGVALVVFNGTVILKLSPVGDLLSFGAALCWAVYSVLLKKTVDTPAQSGLKDAAARRANVLGAYEAVDPENLRGRRVLLVDDICTTGATLSECVRVLRDAGADSVVCVALSRKR